MRSQLHRLLSEVLPIRANDVGLTRADASETRLADAIEERAKGSVYVDRKLLIWDKRNGEDLLRDIKQQLVPLVPEDTFVDAPRLDAYVR